MPCKLMFVGFDFSHLLALVCHLLLGRQSCWCGGFHEFSHKYELRLHHHIFFVSWAPEGGILALVPAYFTFEECRGLHEPLSSTKILG
jgi:hypothetical protein